MTRPETVEALAEVLGEMRAVAWDFFPDPAQAIDDVASAVLAAIDSGRVPGVGRVAPQQVDPEALVAWFHREFSPGCAHPSNSQAQCEAWAEQFARTNPYRSAVVSTAEPGGEVGTGAGEGATGQGTDTAWVTRSADCPEAPAQAHLPAAEPECGCYACIGNRPTGVRGVTLGMTQMIVCATCGNKRCPHGTDHRNECTGSNDPGQPGSRYGGAPVRTRGEEADRG